MWLIYSVVMICIFLKFFSWLCDYYKKKSVRLLRNRLDKPLEKIYAESFRGMGIDYSLFEQLWNIAATGLKVSPEKLRPDDRFGNEIKSAHTADWDYENFYLDILGLAKEKGISNQELDEVKTLADLVILFDKKIVAFAGGLMLYYSDYT